ncbi:MAG TPA: PIN domain-containing protein [Roseiarcus sp.]|jgi:predicted nucleic acid-binding protein
MSTWLIDTALFKMLATPKAEPLLKWCEANDASLYVSAASLTEIALGVSKLSGSQYQRAAVQHNWLNEITARFADRIHSVDALIATRAGTLLSSLTVGHPRHRLHDALLVATAQIHGHGLTTRRDGIFGRWTKIPIAVV